MEIDFGLSVSVSFYPLARSCLTACLPCTIMLKLLIHGGNRLIAIPPLHHSPNTLWYSTSIIASQKSNLAINYLINSLGFPFDQAISIANKAGSFTSSNDTNLVIEFLQKYGFENTQMKYIINCYPRILSMRMGKTLEPKIRVLEGLGMTRDEVVRFVSRHVCYLKSSLGSSILPVFDTLRLVLGSDENLVRALRYLRPQPRLGLPPLQFLEEGLNLLRSKGMDDETIGRLMLKHISFFRRDPSWLRDVVDKVESRLGLCGDSKMFVIAIQTFGSISESNWESKMVLFKSYGWDDSDIVALGRANPITLRVSNGKLKRGLDFFMKEVGYDPKFIAARPALLMYSMEKKVRPRHTVLQILKDKMLIKESIGLYSALVETESGFLEHFVSRYKVSGPQLKEIYENSMKASSRIAG